MDSCEGQMPGVESCALPARGLPVPVPCDITITITIIGRHLFIIIIIITTTTTLNMTNTSIIRAINITLITRLIDEGVCSCNSRISLGDAQL
jgi:hypothetical protein